MYCINQMGDLSWQTMQSSIAIVQRRSNGMRVILGRCQYSNRATTGITAGEFISSFSRSQKLHIFSFGTNASTTKRSTGNIKESAGQRMSNLCRQPNLTYQYSHFDPKPKRIISETTFLSNQVSIIHETNKHRKGLRNSKPKKLKPKMMKNIQVKLTCSNNVQYTSLNLSNWQMFTSTKSINCSYNASLIFFRILSIAQPKNDPRFFIARCLI